MEGRLLEKFKMPKLSKFGGTREHQVEEKTSNIVLFPVTKRGASSWYHGLESTNCKDWEELVRRFIQQYSYNTT